MEIDSFKPKPTYCTMSGLNNNNSRSLHRTSHVALSSPVTESYDQDHALALAIAQSSETSSGWDRDRQEHMQVLQIAVDREMGNSNWIVKDVPGDMHCLMYSFFRALGCAGEDALAPKILYPAFKALFPPLENMIYSRKTGSLTFGATLAYEQEIRATLDPDNIPPDYHAYSSWSDWVFMQCARDFSTDGVYAIMNDFIFVQAMAYVLKIKITLGIVNSNLNVTWNVYYPAEGVEPIAEIFIGHVNDNHFVYIENRYICFQSAEVETFSDVQERLTVMNDIIKCGGKNKF